jgi:hypothetical protein
MISVSSDLDAVTAGCCADCGQLVLRRTPWFDEKAKAGAGGVHPLFGADLPAPAIRSWLLRVNRKGHARGARVIVG